MYKFLRTAAVAATAVLAPVASASAANWVMNSQDVIDFGLGSALNAPIHIDALDGNTDGPSVQIVAPNGLGLGKKSIPKLDKSALLETDGGKIRKVLGTNAAPYGEINNEGLRFDFSEAVVLSQLSVAHLYPAGEHNDRFGEVGVIEVTRADQSVVSFFLRPDSETTANLYSSLSFSTADLVPLATVTNLQPAIDGRNDGSDGAGDIVVEKKRQGGPGNQGGVWQILGGDIFGELVSLTLRGLDQDNINGNTGDSDFSFVAFGGNVAAVPVPPSLAFLITGLIGFGFLARSRKA